MKDGTERFTYSEIGKNPKWEEINESELVRRTRLISVFSLGSSLLSGVGARKFGGHVVQIGQLLGPKNISTRQSTERVDRKFLEVLIELNPGVRFPPGLLVDSFIVHNAEQTAALQ